jgi:hypothetical protein
MEIHGGCDCGNIKIVWNVDEPPRAPRACQCDYCTAQQASYVSAPGSGFSATIRRPEHHRIIHQGTETADFHECSVCNRLVFVSSNIEGDIYGVINSRCLRDLGLETPVHMQFTQESKQVRLERRRRNWCHPVHINGRKPATAHAPAGSAAQH